MASKMKKYKALKYAGDDAYSWAIFLTSEVRGLRSPVSEYSNAKPLYTGLNFSQKKYYLKQLEESENNKMVRTWVDVKNIDKINNLNRNLPYMIHGDTNKNQLNAYPTHTHGLNTVNLPEMFINAAAFGPKDNSRIINMVAIALILNKEYYNEFMEKTFIEMKTGMFSKEDDMIICLRKVEPNFLGVVKCEYGNINKSLTGFAQIWVKGDNHVLVDDYFEYIPEPDGDSGPCSDPDCSFN